MAYVPAPGYQPAYNPVSVRPAGSQGSSTSTQRGEHVAAPDSPRETLKPLPYVTPIAGGLQPGMSVYVQGMVPHHTQRFRVNFACGSQKGADIALHFNPRFESGDKLVLNSFQGSWGREQHTALPFRKGQHFELVFLVTPQGYQVTVNRAPCCDFQHRIPPERVQLVDVDGDLELQSLNVIGGRTMGGGGMYYPDAGMPMMSSPTSYHPQVPYEAKFPGGLTAKMTVVVRGFVPQGAKSFRINFTMGRSKDIALHINPRVNERLVVRNSRLNGQWGSEERELPHNPFQPGQYFDLSIRCGNQRFKVFANGQPLFNYAHRCPSFQQIDTLAIDGDVVLSYVQF
ncbi:galectin-4 isoform X2 [Pelodiscus sinensis]|uniref:galectin-4 isoform X2 n=1 Tax=Pelodiscus sinensis TaxID=13735 RepID=UPI003F6D8083